MAKFILSLEPRRHPEQKRFLTHCSACHGIRQLEVSGFSSQGQPMLSKDFISDVSEHWTKSKASIKGGSHFTLNVP